MAQIETGCKMRWSRLLLVSTLGISISGCQMLSEPWSDEEDLQPAPTEVSVAKPIERQSDSKIPPAPATTSTAYTPPAYSKDLAQAQHHEITISETKPSVSITTPDSTTELRSADSYFSGNTVSVLQPTPPAVASPPSTSRYVTADGQPYPELDAYGNPITTSSVLKPAPATTTNTSYAGGGYSVHLASYTRQVNVTEGWETLSRQYGDLLGNLSPMVSTVDIEGRGRFLRLKAGSFASRADASALCAQLEQRGAYCAVMDANGSPLY